MRISDWSSDVCSSDLTRDSGARGRRRTPRATCRSGFFLPKRRRPPTLPARKPLPPPRTLMPTRPYLQLDVFADRPGAGNPLAVVHDAQGLDDDTMQAIARWTRLPETTFVFPATTPDADYRLRIFSPRHEVPFAGHPSVGTAHAVLEAGLAAPHAGLLVRSEERRVGKAWDSTCRCRWPTNPSHTQVTTHPYQRPQIT